MFLAFINGVKTVQTAGDNGVGTVNCKIHSSAKAVGFWVADSYVQKCLRFPLTSSSKP